MANELIKQNYKNIANAIRSKTGKNGTLTAEAMPTEINTELAKKPTGTKSITANADNIDVAEFAAVNVNVPNPSTGTLDITENNIYDVTNYASVDVQVSGGGSLMAESIYLTDENGEAISRQPYEGLEYIYYVDSENTLNEQSLSGGKIAYYDEGYGECQTLDVSSGNLFYYDSGSFQSIDSLGEHDVVYGDSGSYFTFTLQLGTYYQAGCYSAIEVADFDENCLYIFDSYGSSLNTPEPIGDVNYDKLNLVSYCAGSELYCKTFDIPNVGEDVTVTLSGNQFSGSFKITRLS